MWRSGPEDMTPHTNFCYLISNIDENHSLPLKQKSKQANEQKTTCLYFYVLYWCVWTRLPGCSPRSSQLLPSFPPLRPGSAEEKTPLQHVIFPSTAHSMSTALSSSPAAWSGAPCTSRRSFGARTPSALTRRIMSSSSKTTPLLLTARLSLRHLFFCLSVLMWN